MIVINIYGDNIIECERAINLIQKAIELHEGEVTKEFIDGNLITPSFILSSKNTYKITLYSGTASNRWNIDIYQEIIKDNGGTLREGADAIITIVSKGNNSYQEEARLAFEFSSALPAGNNSWQRSGRALSFSQAKVPYIYSTEVGGYELDSNGNKKATRQASSSLVLSYILNSRRKQILNLIHYRLSPSASEQIKKQFSFLSADISIENILYKSLHSNIKYSDIIELMNHDENVYNLIAKNEENYYLLNGSFEPSNYMVGIRKQNSQWKKKTSVQLTDSFAELKNVLKKYCLNPYNSESLPFGVLPKENINNFLEDIKKIYSPELFSSIKRKILNSNSDVVFALLSGYKPKGEDSRPDRGVIPFIRMLLGEDIPIITIIYGPMPDSHRKSIDNGKLKELSQSNGLISTIYMNSDFLIVDCLKNGGFPLFCDISRNPQLQKNNSLSVAVNRFPKQIGEQDVDTIIHMLFHHGLDNIFESFCNPPGGDWSGISIIKNQIEYRWLSLPRAPKGVKRPDHIFQISDNTLLVIESKDFKSTLLRNEKNVGPEMIDYLKNLLFPRNVSAIRYLDANDTFQEYDKTSDFSHIQFFTAVAFIVKNSTDLSMQSVEDLINKTNTDLVLAIEVINEQMIKIHYHTRIQQLIDLLSSENQVLHNFGKVKLLKIE